VPTVTVNGVLLAGASPRVPGCSLRTDVTGIAEGDHSVGLVVTGTEPSGTGTLIDDAAATTSGAVTFGPTDVHDVIDGLGLVMQDNGYHLLVTVSVDGATAVSLPIWLACGAAQHQGSAVRMTFAAEWDSGGAVGSPAPARLPADFALVATSSMGTATCTYPAGDAQLTCVYQLTETEDGQVPTSLKVSGLGTYTVVERNLPAGWAPDPTTVGVFAANPTLPGAGGAGSMIQAAESGGAAQLHTVVNVRQSGTAAVGSYWLAASDGGVFAFGDAGFHGSMGATPLNEPIVGMAASPSGDGYWLVASDGGVFAFGGAGFHGSMGATPLNEPIVGMAASASGDGYWLVASDGGVFAFGDAGFHGSMGATPLHAPVVGMAASPSGDGYWMVASDGGIFAFGDAGFHGSFASGGPDRSIVAVDPTPTGAGYRLITADGWVYTFGDAGSGGVLGTVSLAAPIVGVASR